MLQSISVKYSVACFGGFLSLDLGEKRQKWEMWYNASIDGNN